jgi:hypothetical protein
MKVQAQVNDQPVLRSVVKLMMNSMYGRFGMHVDGGITLFTTLEGLNSLVVNNRVVDSRKIGDLYLVTYVPDPPLGERVEGTKVNLTSRAMETNVPIAVFRCSPPSKW